MEIVHYNKAKYAVGDIVRVAVRYPVGHYRVPMYMRGKQVRITQKIGVYVNPETEAFGKNAGDKMWCYHVAIPQTELWPDYQGKGQDSLIIEIFESWLMPVAE